MCIIARCDRLVIRRHGLVGFSERLVQARFDFKDISAVRDQRQGLIERPPGGGQFACCNVSIGHTGTGQAVLRVRRERGIEGSECLCDLSQTQVQCALITMGMAVVRL